jgi:hypothetical protein
VKVILDHILDSSKTPGQAEVIVIFKTGGGQAIPGAFRRHEKLANVYELLIMAQFDQRGAAIPVATYFEADEVARIMVPREIEMPVIARPNGGSGLIIPT